MAYILWPSALHFEPERETLQIDLNSGNLEQDMDQGASMSRRRFVNSPQRQTFNWFFTAEEYTIFAGFWTTTLNKGTRSFKVNIWDGSGYRELVAKFVGDVKPVAAGVSDMRVQAVVEIRGDVTLDEGASWMVGEYGADFVDYWTDALQRLVNVDMPAALVNQ